MSGGAGDPIGPVPGTGCFVCVVGPSGAGKDTLMDLARQALAGDGRFVFARRFITREPAPGEDHEPISEAAFDEGERTGAFAISWRAHGLGYGVPASVDREAAAGRVVIANLSRTAVPLARARFDARVVLVTAPPDVLAERIARRGREGAAEALARLCRQVETPQDCDLAIDNVGTPEATAGRLTAFLKRLAAPQGATAADDQPSASVFRIR